MSGYALEMIFQLTELGIKKEIFFELSFFFYPKKWKNKSDSTVPPCGRGAPHEVFITMSLLLLHQLAAS